MNVAKRISDDLSGIHHSQPHNGVTKPDPGLRSTHHLLRPMRLTLWLRLLKGLAGLAGLVLATDILLIAFEVGFRNLGIGGLGWVSDIVEYSLPLATLLVAPWLVSTNGHVRLDLLAERLDRRRRRALLRLTMWLAGAVSSVLVYASLLLVVDTYRSQALVMKSLTFPEWWVMAAVPPLFLLITIECLRNAIGHHGTDACGEQA